MVKIFFLGFIKALMYVVTTSAIAWTLLGFIPMWLNPCGEGSITVPVAGEGFYCVKATKWEAKR